MNEGIMGIAVFFYVANEGSECTLNPKPRP